MKKISLVILTLLVALTACKKDPEVNLKYVDVERDLITVGTTTATVQCDYQYIATLKKAYLYYGEGENEADMNTAEMRVVQNTLYVDLAGLKGNTTYSYFYEFYNGFNSMRTAVKTFKTEGGSGQTVILPTVVTAAVTEITTNSAKGGGEVTNDGGAEVTGRGICWSTNENPTLSDNHVAAGTGTGAFTAMMNGLEAGTTYHVRAYATNEAGTAYGLDREFVTVSGGGTIEEYVDLCLPSGTLWATCNLGANSPEEYGDYYAWGETEPKTTFTVGTYKYCNGDFYSLTKYCNDPSYGYNGFTDNLAVLLAEDDAATLNLGDNWCMPTKEQWLELFENTDTTWTTQNGVFGLLLTSSCNSLFLPAAGHYNGNTGVAHDIEGVGSEGLYWSSVLDTNYPITSWMFSFTSDGGGIGTSFRYSGQSIRPVRKTNTPTPPSNVPEGAINGLFTINANGDQVYFSQGNLQYQASTNTWRFAEHQWDYVGTHIEVYSGDFGGNVDGSDNLKASEDYNGWIDVYNWATSGYNHGASLYHPWSFGGTIYDYNAYGGTLYNLYDQTGQADWGYNAISNGGNVENQWRTLKIEEWDFILNLRNTYSGVRFVRANVNGVNGLVIFPDNWNTSFYVLNGINEISNGNYDVNTIDESDWQEIMQRKGAVFLPAGGVREGFGASLGGIGTAGWYWSSSCSSSGHAYNAFFSMLKVIANGEHAVELWHGQSVRLVQDAN